MFNFTVVISNDDKYLTYHFDDSADLDVRTVEEFVGGRPPGSVNVPVLGAGKQGRGSIHQWLFSSDRESSANDSSLAE